MGGATFLLQQYLSFIIPDTNCTQYMVQIRHFSGPHCLSVQSAMQYSRPGPSPCCLKEIPLKITPKSG